MLHNLKMYAKSPEMSSHPASGSVVLLINADTRPWRELPFAPRTPMLRGAFFVVAPKLRKRI